MLSQKWIHLEPTQSKQHLSDRCEQATHGFTLDEGHGDTTVSLLWPKGPHCPWWHKILLASFLLGNGYRVSESIVISGQLFLNTSGIVSFIELQGALLQVRLCTAEQGEPAWHQEKD